MTEGLEHPRRQLVGGELLGVERKAAAAFTFYLAVPTMLGASVFELYKQHDALTSANMTTIAVGFVVSFIVAYVVVKTFIAFIGRYGLKPFGWYRVAAGLALIDALLARGELPGYYLAHSARADLCRRLGRKEEATEAYQRALELVTSEPERRFLEKRLRELA